MSLLGKRRLGVSSTSPFTPQQTRPDYQVPIHPATEDIEDLESLIRSIADELERAEKAKAKGSMPTGKDSWSSGSEGTRSPDLLATPVSAADSEPFMGLDTPPSMGDTQESPTSHASSGRRGLDKAQQSNSRPKERSQAMSTSTSSSAAKSTARITTANETVKREKSSGKSKTKATSEERAQSTRTRSRREGLDGSKGGKESIERTEMQTFLRVALLCMYTHVPLGWANTQI